MTGASTASAATTTVSGCHSGTRTGTFTDLLYVLDDFGADQGWGSIEEHPRFLIRTTGDEAVDIV